MASGIGGGSRHRRRRRNQHHHDHRHDLLWKPATTPSLRGTPEVGGGGIKTNVMCFLWGMVILEF